jgi:hypothetical protein
MNLFASPPSLYRGLACFIGLFGTFMANRLPLLLGGLLIVLVIMGIQGKLREFARFGLTVLLHIGGALIVIWGFVRKSGPNGEHSPEDGVLFAVLTILRLALLGAIFLVTVLTLSPDRLSHLLHTFGIRGWALAGVISYLNLWSDFRRNIKQIYASRCARRLMPDRSFGLLGKMSGGNGGLRSPHSSAPLAAAGVQGEQGGKESWI